MLPPFSGISTSQRLMWRAIRTAVTLGSAWLSSTRNSVRNMIVISTAAERDGWYPEGLEGDGSGKFCAGRADEADADLHALRRSGGPSGAVPASAQPVGKLMRKDYDWRPEIAKLPHAGAVVCRRSRRRLDETRRGVLRFVWRWRGGCRIAVSPPEYARARLTRAGLHALQFRPGARYTPT